MKQYLLILSVLLVTFTSHSQANLSLGVTVHSGNFALEGSENGREIEGYNSGRRENKAEAKLAGLGFLASLGITDQIDIVYDWNLQYGKEQTPDAIRTINDDAYTVKSHNIGAKYQVYEWKNLSPYVKLAYTNYQVTGFGVFDSSLTSASQTREYDYRGNGLTFGLGLEYEMNGKFWFISYERLFSLGQMKTDDGEVQFDNGPRLRRIALGFRFSLFN